MDSILEKIDSKVIAGRKNFKPRSLLIKIRGLFFRHVIHGCLYNQAVVGHPL